MYFTLLDDYKKFEKIMLDINKKSKYIDTSKYSFLAPTTLIPLLCESRKRKLPIKLNHWTKDYVKRIVTGAETSTNTPYQILPRSAKERQDQELSRKITEKIDGNYGGSYTLHYIFTELTNNIYNHTPFEEELASQGYTYAQEYPNEHKLDLCVMDDGLGIPGRFIRSGIKFDDDCHAIEIAISNNSTVSDDKEEHGNGLWSTIRLTVEGNGGEVLIVSGQGCLHIRNKKYKYYMLENKNIFKGTLISMRFNKQEVQNFYDYIDVFPGNPYKYEEGMKWYK